MKIFLLISVILALNTACWQGDVENRASNARKYPGATPSAGPANSGANNSKGNSLSTNGAENNMNKGDSEIKSGGFTANLPDGFQQPSDDVGKRMLKEYGAVFVARGGASAPKTVIFKNEQEVSAFQASVSNSSEKMGAFTVELQTAAINALKQAIGEAGQNNLSITPRGADSAKRSYGGTVSLWASRVDPGSPIGFQREDFKKRKPTGSNRFRRSSRCRKSSNSKRRECISARIFQNR